MLDTPVTARKVTLSGFVIPRSLMPLNRPGPKPRATAAENPCVAGGLCLTPLGRQFDHRGKVGFREKTTHHLMAVIRYVPGLRQLPLHGLFRCEMLLQCLRSLFEQVLLGM